MNQDMSIKYVFQDSIYYSPPGDLSRLFYNLFFPFLKILCLYDGIVNCASLPLQIFSRFLASRNFMSNINARQPDLMKDSVKKLESSKVF